MGMGVLIVAAAGPISNLCLAAAFTGLLAVTALLPLAPEGFKALLETMVLLNVVLAVFNLLPIPPLDGSRIVDAFVPREMRPAWDAFARIAPVALIAVLVLPSLTGFSLLDWPVEQVRRLIEAVKR
jgi:Zn-dependent protease